MARREQGRPSTAKPKSRIPHFKTIEEEAEFWDTHDTTEFEEEFEEVPDVKFVIAQRKKAITVRLGADTYAALTKEAHKKGMGPSTLVRMWVLERLNEGEGPSYKAS